MSRKPLFALGALLSLLVLVIGIADFARGDGVMGPILILLGALGTSLLVAFYARDPRAKEGVLESVLEFFGLR
jgi:hypothetical protein